MQTNSNLTEYVVIGAGPVGTTIALQLAHRGSAVRVLTRSGDGPDHPLVERRSLDANDTAALQGAVAGAKAIFHCMHGSAYSEKVWRTELPAAERSVLEAAGLAGAVVVFPESLYSYSRPDRPMTEDGPRDWPDGKGAVRAALLAQRAASATPTVSVVASDFVGPHVTSGGHLGERVVRPVLEGGTVRVLGSLDEPHSWTFVPDLAATMVRAADSPELWGSVLHAPTNEPRTQREMVTAYAEAAGRPVPKLASLPGWMLRLIGLVHTETRELAAMQYQFTAPFVMDSSRSQARLGLTPTPMETVVAQTVSWWQDRLAAGDSVEPQLDPVRR